MSGHGEKLSRRKEAAIAALLMHSTLADAAPDAGVSLATLRRWLQIPEFAHAYQAARAEVVERAIGRLEAQAGEAAETLIRNLRSGRPAAEIRAAVALLSTAWWIGSSRAKEKTRTALSWIEQSTSR